MYIKIRQGLLFQGVSHKAIVRRTATSLTHLCRLAWRSLHSHQRMSNGAPLVAVASPNVTDRVVMRAAAKVVVAAHSILVSATAPREA